MAVHGNVKSSLWSQKECCALDWEQIRHIVVPLHCYPLPPGTPKDPSSLWPYSPQTRTYMNYCHLWISSLKVSFTESCKGVKHASIRKAKTCHGNLWAWAFRPPTTLRTLPEASVLVQPRLKHQLWRNIFQMITAIKYRPPKRRWTRMESMTQKSNWFEVQTLNLKILEIMPFKCYRKLIEGVLHIISKSDTRFSMMSLWNCWCSLKWVLCVSLIWIQCWS